MTHLQKAMESGRRRVAIVHFFVPLFIGCCMVPTAHAQVTADAASPIRYRRIFVPADRPDTWPVEGRKFLPLSADEVERLLRTASQSAPPAALVEATYYATVRETGELAGAHGEWSFQLGGDRPALYDLGDVSFAIHEPAWRDVQQPVRWGRWAKSGAAPGSLALQVPRAGVLQFAWSAELAKANSGYDLLWKAPIAASSLWILDLPEQMEAEFSGAIEQADTEVAKERLPPVAAGLRRWAFLLPPAFPAVLHLHDRSREIAPALSRSVVREEIRYQVGQRGIELVGRWRIDPSTSGEFAIQLPSSLNITSMSRNGKSTSWRIDKTTGFASVEISPLSTNGTGEYVIELHAWQTIPWGKPWQLPKPQCESTQWTSGTATLSVEPGLELQALESAGYLQTATELATGAGGQPERHEFQALDAAAQLTVVLDRAASSASVRSATVLTTGAPDISGRLISRFEVHRGALYTLEGELPPGWVVESVETVPANALREWFVETGDPVRRLSVQLVRAVRPERPVTVVVHGRLPRPGESNTLAAETLPLVRWRSAALQRHIVAFQIDPAQVPRPTGDIRGLKPEELEAVDQTLLGTQRQDAVFDITAIVQKAAEGTVNDSIRLSTQRPQFDAQIAVDVHVSESSLEHQYTLTLEVASGRLDRVYLFATRPLPLDLKWIERESSAPVAAERVAEGNSRRTEFPAGGELWLLRLAQPKAGYISLMAKSATSQVDAADVPFLSLPDADQQSALVVLRSDPGLSVTHESAHISVASAAPHPPRSRVPADSQSARAVWRYSPDACERQESQPRLRLASAPATDAELIVTRRVTIESQYADHSAVHRATIEIEDHGAANWQVELAPGVRMERAEVAGRTIAPLSVDEGGRVSLPLPQLVSNSTITLYLAEASRTLRTGQVVPPPITALSSPPLEGEWSICYPVSVAMVGPDSAAGDMDWRARLLGPLALTTSKSKLDGESALEADMFANRKSAALSNCELARISFVGQLPPPVTFAHRPTVAAWSWLTFLTANFVGRRLRKRVRPFLATIAAAAALSLLLPAAYAPIATGGFLGLAASLLLITPPAAAAHWYSRPWLRWTRRLGPAVIGISFCNWVLCAVAQEVERDTTLPLHAVLVPVDSQKQPVGYKWFVEDALLRKLLLAAEARANHGQAWLLCDASYQLRLEESRDVPGIQAAVSSLSFEIEVLAPQTTVALPLSRDDGEWGTAQLDGIVTPLDWQSTEQLVTFQVANPGRYRLTIEFTPRTRDMAGKRHLRLHVPRFRGATLALAHPAGLEGITINGASWMTPFSSVTSRRARCDTTETIELSWPRQDVQLANAREIQLAELHWLKVSNDQILLNAKYVVDGRRRPEALTLNFDPAWELLTAVEDLAPSDSDASAENRQSVRIPLPDDVDHRCEVELQFRLREAIGPGVLRLPPIATASLPVTERWLAVSVSTEMESQVVPKELPLRDASEFLTRWQGNRDRVHDVKRPDEIDPRPAPQIAVVLEANSPAPAVILRPRIGEATIQDQLHVAAELAEWRLDYRAQIAPAGNVPFQLSLRVPEGLSVTSVVVDGEGEAVPVRHPRFGANDLTFFIGKPMTRPFRIAVAGRLPRSAGTGILPVMALRDRPEVPLVLSLSHAEHVVVRVDPLIPLVQPGASAAPVPTGEKAQLVGVYQIPSSRFADTRVESVNLPTPTDVSPQLEQLPTGSVAQASPSDPELSKDSATARLRLVDTKVTQDVRGNTLVVTRLVVVPSTSGRFQLQLPSQHRFAELRIGGESIGGESIGGESIGGESIGGESIGGESIGGESIGGVRPAANRINLPLGSPGLPQMVEVVAVAAYEASRGHVVEQPVLLVDERPVAAEMSLWSVERPASTQLPKFDLAMPMTAADLDALRLDRCISIVEAATPAGGDRGRVEVVEWANAWSRQFDRLQTGAALINEDSTVSTPGTLLVPAEKEVQRAATRDRIATWQGLFAETRSPAARIGQSSTALPTTDGEWISSSGRWPYQACFAASGPVESIRINAIHDTRFFAGRPGALVVLASLAAAAIWAAGRPEFLARFRRDSQSTSP